MAGLEAAQKCSKRQAEITAHLDTLDDDELDLRLRQIQRGNRRGFSCGDIGKGADLGGEGSDPI